MRTLSVILAATMLLLSRPSFGIQAAQTQDIRIPLTVELLAPVSARGTGVGKRIYARAMENWKGPGCTIRTGATLKGRLIAAGPDPKNPKITTMALGFDTAECGKRREIPLTFVIFAVLAPDPESGLNASPAMSEAIEPASGTFARGLSAADMSRRMREKDPGRSSVVTPGSVAGIHGIKLSYATGPEGSSVVSASGRDVRIERASRFLLLARKTTGQPAVSGPGAPEGDLDPAPLAEATIPSLADETEVCSPPGCSIELAAADQTDSSRTDGSIPTAALGYSPRSNRESEDFDHEAAIAYLSASQLLLTFDRRGLVRRNPGEPAARIVRAALVDTAARKVIRTVDWRVTGAQRYLWPLAGSRVLAYIGGQLHVYGEGLVKEREIALGGPLAFLSVAPSGKRIALGIERERHTPETHRQLEEELGGPPEEDIEMRVLGDNFEMLGSMLNPGRVAAPVLSDNGELRLVFNTHQNRFRVVEVDWNRKQRDIASFVSVCPPELASMQSSLLVVSGCAPMLRASRWQRVLKSDGKVVLRTTLLASQKAHHVVGDMEGRVFALSSVRTGKPFVRGTAFRPTDLVAGDIAVYRAQDGKRLASILLDSPTASKQTLALSPNGEHLAVLTGTGISFYNCKSSPARN